MMFCPKCGANNEEGAVICSFCRTQLVQPVPVNQSQPSQPVNPYSQPVNPYSRPVNQYNPPVNTYGQPGNSYGQPLNAYVQPQPMAYGAKMSKGEFYVHPVNAQIHKNVKVNAILLYIVVGLTFLLNLGVVAQASSVPGVVGIQLFITDTIISIGEFVAILIVFCVIQTLFTLLSHLMLNFVWAILLAVTMFVFALVVGFSVGTVIWVGCAISQAIQLYKLNSKYSIYLRTGVIG